MQRYIVIFITLSFLVPYNSYALKNRPVIVELFTSQGCPACPPAEKFLNKLISEDGGRGEIFPLAFHVDYWNYLGWKDPFSSYANTERQKRYAEQSGNSSIYTPQIVIDGKYIAAGNNIKEIRRYIKKAEREREKAIPIVFATGGNEVEVIIGKYERGNKISVSSLSEYYVWLFAIKTKAKTNIIRGENRGKTMIGRNIVHKLRLLGKWTGGMASYTVNLKNYSKADILAVIVQEKGEDSAIGAIRGVVLYDL